MLRANHGRICYKKAISSMLPFDTVGPSTPLFGVPQNTKEMKTCRWVVCSINCIPTSESGTLLPFSFSRSSRATLSAVSAVHSLVKASKTTLKHQNSLKSLFELQHESTSASLSCLCSYYSNMAPRTVKRAIVSRSISDESNSAGTFLRIQSANIVIL